MFFFDNNVSRHIVDALKCLGVEATHLQEHFPADTEDTVWIPHLRKHGWILITADSKMRKRPAEAIALREENVVAVFLMKEYPSKPKFEQASWIFKHWPAVEKEATHASPGTVLYCNHQGRIEPLNM